MKPILILISYAFLLDLLKNIFVSIIIGIGSFVLGRLPITYKNLKYRKLRKFIGRSANNINSIVVSVPIFHPLDDIKDCIENYRFKKKDIDDSLIRFAGPENVMADKDVSASSLIISMLSPINKKVIEPQSDEETLNIWQNRCIFCIGATLTNMKTKQVYDKIKNIPIQWKEAPNDLYNIRLKISKNNMEFISTKEVDYGLILKVPNPYSKGDFIFVLAGNAEFGTIASSQYLKNNWEQLYDKSNRKPFFCVIKVDPHSLECADEVYFEIFNI